MLVPATLKDWHKGNDHQRQGDEREQDVRDQDRKINPGDQSSVTGGFFAFVQMINDVADEKTARRDEGRDHARHVLTPQPAPDQKPAAREKHRAHGIK